MSMGMAKPMPWALPATAVLTPMTWPSESSSAPPELPGLMAASVWIRLRRLRGWPVASSVTVIERPVALTTPVVTLFSKSPSGLPMAMASWPISSVVESPKRRHRQVGALDLDDGKVGQRVDAVGAALELATVLELDGDGVGAGRRRGGWSGSSRRRRR